MTAGRPRQVTILGWSIVLGSAFTVVLAFDTMTGLHSIGTRDEVQKFVTEPPGNGLGLDVEGVLTVLRALAMVAAGCAAAAAVLGVHVLKRNRAARLGLSLIAVPLLVTGLVLGGFVSSLVVAATVLLWMQPARDWLDGREQQARAASVFQAPPPVPPAAPPTYAAASEQAPSALPLAPARPAAVVRPPSVRTACIVTWLVSALGIVATVAGLAVIAWDPDALVSEMHRQNPDLHTAGLSDGMILGVTYAIGLAFMVWAAAAMLLAALVWRGVGWARVVLLISTFGAIGLCLVTTISTFVMLLPAAAAVGTLMLLLRPETEAWCRPQHRPRASSRPSGSA